MPSLQSEHWLLDRARGVIDGVDDALIVLLAARRRLVRLVASAKAHRGIPGRDVRREQHIRVRAHALAARVGVPSSTALALVDLAIADACAQQGLAGVDFHNGLDADQGAPLAGSSMIFAMPMSSTSSSFARRMLRWLPPPRRAASFARAIPQRWQQVLLEAAMSHVLAAPLGDGSLDFMEGRCLGIEVSDLGLRWVLTLLGGQLCLVAGEPEASVRGSATDLLLLAGRLEDADTLFFQRTLVLTGDTELGLTVRNLLERLPWEELPLGLRIVLNRGARFARMARNSYLQR